MKRILGVLMVTALLSSVGGAQVTRNLAVFDAVCPAVGAVSNKMVSAVFSAADLKQEVDRVFTKHGVRVDCATNKKLSLLINFRSVFEDDASIFVYAVDVTGIVENLQTRYLGFLKRVTVWDRSSTYWVRRDSLSKQGILDNVQRGLSAFVEAWKSTRSKPGMIAVEPPK
jgi:hypothetical protein